MNKLFDEAWKGVVCPLQIKSKPNSYGPRQRVVGDATVVREDVEFIGRRNKKISGFIFSSPDYTAEETIFYLHGNGGSKIEILSLIPYMVEFKLNVVAFDFVACGNSDPGYLTYGIKEVFDIKDMLDETKRHIEVNRVILWGRSMGALCAILFADMYSYEVNGLILDSPFQSLETVMSNIAKRKTGLPAFVLNPFLYLIKDRVKKEVKLDVFSVDYLEIFKNLNSSNMPILFIFSNFDSIVPGQEVLEFYNAYRGPKDLYEIYRTHDEDRPQDLFRQAVMWIVRKKKVYYEGVLQAREIETQNRKKNISADSYFLSGKQYNKFHSEHKSQFCPF